MYEVRENVRRDWQAKFVGERWFQAKQTIGAKAKGKSMSSILKVQLLCGWKRMNLRESARRWHQKVNRKLDHELPIGHYLGFNFYPEKTRVQS